MGEQGNIVGETQPFQTIHIGNGMYQQSIAKRQRIHHFGKAEVPFRLFLRIHRRMHRHYNHASGIMLMANERRQFTMIEETVVKLNH